MMSIASSILAAKSRYRRSSGIAEMTLHCSSFSKCLVPGFRIGWVAAGKQARRIQQLQLMSTLSTSSPMQLAPVDYLSTKRYDAHLRRLRRQLAERKQQAWQALLRHLPPEVIVHHSDSGYFLWIELPEGADASALSARALASHISIARENVLHLRQLDLVFPF
nr:Uncharacterized HTH-type transcriptional regulator ydcR [Klebsiella pneumoniae]